MAKDSSSGQSIDEMPDKQAGRGKHRTQPMKTSLGSYIPSLGSYIQRTQMIAGRLG
jgi:hypothetical protein